MSNAPPAREQVRAFLRGRGTVRWLLFGVVVLIVIVLVATAGEEHSALARSFLRALLRLLT